MKGFGSASYSDRVLLMKTLFHLFHVGDNRGNVINTKTCLTLREFFCILKDLAIRIMVYERGTLVCLSPL